ncbi:MAG: serine/threonine protein kinase [Anaerolineaceae bacterium]|nr:serine/threonine protein kinase [Anaerolineaceae bacterium]
MLDLANQMVKGRYLILRRIGIGGMAMVYLANDMRLRRRVAVKIVRRDAVADDRFEVIRDRFLEEARALAKLDHPNIVRILDYGESDGLPFMVMEYLPNESLADRPESTMDHQSAARVLAAVADALGYAHSRGIVHRDVKPANILFSEAREPKLADFGIAKAVRHDGDQLIDLLVETNVAIGTPEYMAPEIWEKKVGPHSDQYSLGVILFELATGQWPYSGTNSWELANSHLHASIPSACALNKVLPPEVDEVVHRALAKSPAERFATMSAFADALRALAEIEPVEGADERGGRNWLQNAGDEHAEGQRSLWWLFPLVLVLFFGLMVAFSIIYFSLGYG